MYIKITVHSLKSDRNKKITRTYHLFLQRIFKNNSEDLFIFALNRIPSTRAFNNEESDGIENFVQSRSVKKIRIRILATKNKALMRNTTIM